LNRTLSWADIEKTSSLVIKTVLSIQLAGSEMYYDYVYVKQFVTGERVADWTANKTLPAQRWVVMVTHFNKNYLPCSIVLKLVEFLFCLPGANAATERVFSLMNSTWTSGKTQLGVDTLKAVIVTKVNYDKTCVEFFKMLLTKTTLRKFTTVKNTAALHHLTLK
jgi:hypothetical protein